MNISRRGVNLLLSVFLFATTDVSVLNGAEEESLRAVATYECIGLYFKSPDLGRCTVYYDVKGEVSTIIWKGIEP